MKRLKYMPLVLLLFGLTGCIQEYTFTEEQSDSVAEYMAGKLLEYDEDYNQKLITEKEFMEDAQGNTDFDKDASSGTAQESEDYASANSTEKENQTDYSLEEVLDLKGFQIQYAGYKVTDTYPEDGDSTYFSLTPGEENQLLVVSFDVKNASKKEKSLNLSKSKILYQLDINVGTIYKPSLTLLENDLQYIDITVPAKETRQVLLVFEIKKDTNMSDINLIVSKNERSVIIEIK